jgi:Tol biopolymer transport system component
VYHVHVDPEGLPPTGPAWSPDGARLALTAFSSDGRFDEAYVVIVTLRPRRAVRVIQLPDEIGQSRPTWSPDGRALLLSLGAGHLAVVRLDGRGIRYTTGGPGVDTDPDWR